MKIQKSDNVKVKSDVIEEVLAYGWEDIGREYPLRSLLLSNIGIVEQCVKMPDKRYIYVQYEHPILDMICFEEEHLMKVI